MSEEKIIKYIKDEIENETDTYHWFDDNPENKTRKQIEESINAHQGLLDLYQKEKEKNKKAIEMLQEQIKFCEQEAKGSLNNEICHRALYFDKHLLQELLEESE